MVPGGGLASWPLWSMKNLELILFFTTTMANFGLEVEVHTRVCVCVCVCVAWEKGKEGGREGGRERGRGDGERRGINQTKL